MKGSRLSRRALVELVQQVESRMTDKAMSAMENAIECKLRWTDELERRRLNLSELDPIPHPDNVVIDYRTGRVRRRALQKSGTSALGTSAVSAADAQAEVDMFAEKYRKSHSRKWKAMWLSEWHFEQRIFDIINDAMPERYKAKLRNRSYAEGASTEGKTLEQYRRTTRRKAQWQVPTHSCHQRSQRFERRCLPHRCRPILNELGSGKLPMLAARRYA